LGFRGGEDFDAEMKIFSYIPIWCKTLRFLLGAGEFYATIRVSLAHPPLFAPMRYEYYENLFTFFTFDMARLGLCVGLW